MTRGGSLGSPFGDPSHIFLARPTEASPGDRLAVKDLFDTAGLVTTYGSSIFRNHRPERTAEAVLRLERAGYGIVGKANLHEFAWGITSENPHYGTVPNPTAPGRIAGGSSGGCAAALAAGLADAALGTDSGGSIRIPSACCGTVGFKPTHGLVPLADCFPLAPTFDHAGPMARDVAGCVRMIAALVPGFTPHRIGSLDEVRVGVAWTDQCAPLVRTRVEATAALFPGRRRVPLPDAEDSKPAFLREIAEVHDELWREQRDGYGPDVAVKMATAMRVTDAGQRAATRARERFREQIAELTAGFDIVLTPTLPMVAPPAGIGDVALRGRMTRFTYPFNALGAPALSIPCGAAERGLPASIQLVGAPGTDALVLAVGRLLETRLAARSGHPSQATKQRSRR